MATSSAASVRRCYAGGACVPRHNAFGAEQSSSTLMTMIGTRVVSASSTPPPHGEDVNSRIGSGKRSTLGPRKGLMTTRGRDTTPLQLEGAGRAPRPR